MSKVLLVEDDNNLREIFEMRLQAEGYDTVTAGNGEEGLTVAMAEKPDLIITDVMMPKLSGFEMLENLRATPEGKDAKVIMMTALGQAEDQARGEKLGVVKYLVKSQATLDDFARVVREVLPPAGNAPAPANGSNESSLVNQKESENKMPEEPTTPTNPNPATPPADNPVTPPAASAADPAAPLTMPTGVSGDQQSTAQEQSAVTDQINNFVASTPATDPAAATPPADTASPAAPTDNPVSTPGAPDMSTPAGDASSTDAPAFPPATPPADTPPATPPQTDAPAPSADSVTPPATPPADPTSNAI